MTISKQKFNGILAKIKSTGAALDKLIAEGIQYCVQQASNGNFDAFAKLTDACPVYARRIVKDCEAAARATHKKQAWAEGADEAARDAAAAQLEERRTKAAARKPATKKAAQESASKAVQPKADDAPSKPAPSVTTPAYSLASKSETVALSKSEYEFLMTELAKYRTAPAKPAQTPKKQPAQGKVVAASRLTGIA